MIFPSEVAAMNKFYWIPAVGEPKLIESEDSVNKVWHDLMNGPDHHIIFETVHIQNTYDIVMLVDECGKLKSHFVNKFASLLYPGFTFGDYIAGDILIAKIIEVPYIEDNEILFFERDIGSLSQDDIDLINHLLEVHHGSL